LYSSNGKSIGIGKRDLFTMELYGVGIENFGEDFLNAIGSVNNMSKKMAIEVKFVNSETVEEYGGFELYQNIPNPFNSGTWIRYKVGELSYVKIEVLDIVGRRVKVFVDDIVEPGSKMIYWDGRDEFGKELSSGVYICMMYAKSVEGIREYKETRKVVILR